MFKSKNNRIVALIFALSFFMFSPTIVKAKGGEALFKSKCSTCHTPHKDMTGPKLFQVREKWESGGALDGSIHEWVRNWAKVAATDPYAAQVADWSPTAMTTFPDLSDDDIEAIFDYVDAQPEGGGGATATSGGGATTSGGGVVEDKGGIGWYWYGLGILFLVIIFAMGPLKREFENIDGVEKQDYQKFGSKAWFWKNKKWVGLVGFVCVVGLITWGFLGLYSIGVTSAYQPSQPIPFPHDIHAGLDEIDCKYCHSSADKSRTAGYPTTSTCMNCHKQIQGEGDQIPKIEKIYESAGFTPKAGGSYSGETQNIVWNKVHVLADFVFFSHEQHVTVGGIDCKQCHGDMTKQHEVARVVPVEELNKIEGNVQLTKETLTMGWCIECHDKKEVSKGPLEGKGGYYDEIHDRLINNDPSLYEKYMEDGKVTVKELGGWECAKCHY